MTPLTKPPIRTTGEASADGRIGLIWENKKTCGFVAITMNSIIKHKKQPYCTRCQKLDTKRTEQMFLYMVIIKQILCDNLEVILETFYYVPLFYGSWTSRMPQLLEMSSLDYECHHGNALLSAVPLLP